MPDSWIDKEELDELVGSFASPRKRRRAAAKLPRPRRGKASTESAAASGLTESADPNPDTPRVDADKFTLDAPDSEVVFEAATEPGREADPSDHPEGNANAVAGELRPTSPAGLVVSVEGPDEDLRASADANHTDVSWKVLADGPALEVSPFEFDDDDELEFDIEIEESLPEDDLLSESDLSEPLIFENSRVEESLDDASPIGDVLDEEELTGEEEVAEEEVAEEEVAEEEVAEEEVAEEVVAEEVVAEEVVAEEVVEEAISEEPIAGEDLAGEDLAGEDLAGEDLAGEDLAGEDLAEEDLAGEDLAEEEVTAEEFVAAEIAEEEIPEIAIPEPGLDEGDFSEPEEPAIASEEVPDLMEPDLAEQIPVAEMIVAIEEPGHWEREIPDFLDDSESFAMPHSGVERDSERALAALRAARARAEEGRLLRDWKPVEDFPCVGQDDDLEDDLELDPDESSDLALAESGEAADAVEEVDEEPVFRTLAERIAHCVDRAMEEVDALAAVICDDDGFPLYEHVGPDAGLSIQTGLLIDALRQAEARLGLKGEGVTQVSVGGGQWRCLLRASGGSVRLHAGLLLDRPLETAEISIWRDVLADSCRLFSANPI